MDNYIPLSQDHKKELNDEIGTGFNGYIKFLLRGKEVATTDLLEKSFERHRLRTAEMIGVKWFDDYWLLHEDGSVRAKSSDIKTLSVTDVDSDYGTAQGLKYQVFLRRNEDGICKHCGNKLND